MADDDDMYGFQHFSKRYLCCCNSIHVKQGTLMIGLVSSVLIMFQLILVLIFHHDSPTIWTLKIGFILIQTISIIAMFYALRTNRKYFLLLYIIFELFDIIISVILLFISMMAIYEPTSSAGTHIEQYSPFIENESSIFDKHLATNGETSTDKQILIRLTSIALFGVSLVSTIINIWFIIVVCKCYIYYRDIDNYKLLLQNSDTIHVASPMTIAAAAYVVDDQLEIADCIINNDQKSR